VATGFLRKVKSTLILQPGPAALTDGLDALTRILYEWVESQEADVVSSCFFKQG
jgi:iron complex transport system substrate-binding protein